MERQMTCMEEYNPEILRALATREEVREEQLVGEDTEGRVIRVLRKMKGFSDVIFRDSVDLAIAER